MLHKISSFADWSGHAAAEACFVIILSHGSRHGAKDVIYSLEGEMLATDEIEEIFSNKNCPDLVRKPKVFIYQACRGDVPDGVGSSSSSDTDYLETDGPVIHKFSDLLVVRSTVPGLCTLLMSL